MSEQPSQSTSYDRPPILEHDFQANFHMSNLDKYDAEEIAKVRDAPLMRETTPEELAAMAVREAYRQLSQLHAVRKQRMGQ